MLLLLVSLKVEKFSIGYKLRNGIPSKRTQGRKLLVTNKTAEQVTYGHTHKGGNPALFFTDIVVVVDDIQC